MDFPERLVSKDPLEPRDCLEQMGSLVPLALQDHPVHPDLVESLEVQDLPDLKEVKEQQVPLDQVEIKEHPEIKGPRAVRDRQVPQALLV